eukprot:TRINITY_DN2599_c0_g1_i1.p1 TRINITY_DN2599_c0_g1~~TRINITY_DN2599_c0_g1_i1.p1  ORF type:complete len:110 (+),score=24.76 TRINITY_DN2599_c0_g1_i1:196-525(+)
MAQDPDAGSFYELLEVRQDATTDEIRASYRRLALAHHPDKNPGHHDSGRFQQISAAYKVLSDPQQRQWYDEHGEVDGAAAAAAGAEAQLAVELFATLATELIFAPYAGG